MCVHTDLPCVGCEELLYVCPRTYAFVRGLELALCTIPRPPPMTSARRYVEGYLQLGDSFQKNREVDATRASRA